MNKKHVFIKLLFFVKDGNCPDMKEKMRTSVRELQELRYFQKTRHNLE